MEKTVQPNQHQHQEEKRALRPRSKTHQTLRLVGSRRKSPGRENAARRRDQQAATKPPTSSQDNIVRNESEPKVKQQNNNVRGRKSKMKKMAKKYADQDDEDRELAIIALQGGGKLTKKQKKKNKGGHTNNASSESSNQLKAAADTTALLIKNAEEVVDEKLSLRVRTILAECVTVNASGGGNSGTGEEKKTAVRWDKLDAEVLEDLVKLDSIDAQAAAANRLLTLTQSTRVDNFSASLAGIIRTVHKYGYEGIQPIDNEDE